MNQAKRRAILTAAAGGIGLATARLLAAQGVQLSLVDSNAARLAECARELRAAGADLLVHDVDVTDEEAHQMTHSNAAELYRFPAKAA